MLMNVLNSNTHRIDIVALNMISALLSASRGHARDDSLMAKTALEINATGFVSANRRHARDDSPMAQTMLEIIAILICVRESPTRARRLAIGATCITYYYDLYFCPRLADTRAAISYWYRLYYRSIGS